jgi:hypothetical protein
MENVQEYIEKGIIAEAFQAQMNLRIWNEIGSNVKGLSKLDKDKQQLFSYLQRSAQSQMVLRTARIYDVQKKYPTRCLDSLFKLVEGMDLTNMSINNPRALKEYLERLSCRDQFFPVKDSVSDFLLPFIDYCRTEILGKTYEREIALIKLLRDKYIAHNEAIEETTTFDPNIIKTLSDVAVAISIVIERCLIVDSIYDIERSVDRNVYFIKKLIKDNLK